MLLLVGALPVDNLPVTLGRLTRTDEGVLIGDKPLSTDRGTAALLSVVCTVCKELGLENPWGLLAGDIGTRQGSMAIYDYLAERLPEINADIVTFHYIMPDLKKNKKVLETIKALNKRPVLIADAGSMYVAKAGGDAPFYDIFTPDLGESAYLADEEAPHPTYTRGFIFQLEQDVPALIKRAYEYKNGARTMFVKGKIDYIVQEGKIIEEISEPQVPALEPIGGTGDLITGLITAMVHAGKSHLEACRIAGRVNRRAGQLCNPTPATQVSEIIEKIPQALREILKQREGIQ